ncbi:CpsB/CapC family capsule biosynthesis tyrosine phosphatase [Clostridium sp.]|uniref:CpsB/CapC family capsule biosynthesis tyrosine phosphatase n=1 Tax=Clostridium sp. TaxID=1506 RepID=UPI0026351B47|nr:CpsB/CapC family capsule biosynthesis tyrosine phosphatase [Clostridium sp.]
MLFANLLFKELVSDGKFEPTILLKNIDEAVKCNIKKLVLAPAYYDEESKTSIKEVENMVEELNLHLKEKEIDLTVYPANLLRDNYENIKSYISGNLGSINNSKYVLLDIEECNKIDDILEIVFEYMLRNITPIIVAPERIEEIIKDNKKIEKLIKEGCLFQLDPASLEGIYGKTVKKAAKALIKKDIYKFIGFQEEIDRNLINTQTINISKKSLFILKQEGEITRKTIGNKKSKF